VSRSPPPRWPPSSRASTCSTRAGNAASSARRQDPRDQEINSHDSLRISCRSGRWFPYSRV
jgi:hypothetical protein